MRALLPFLRLFKFAKLPLFLGLVLMITGLVSSIGLLTTSGWFLAATPLRVLARYLISSIHLLLCVGLLLAAPFSAILKS